ncbi:MAG: hypothetical protein JNM20_17880 [Rhizobiales bacterium]|nr:hypothetical protein [Hyphomicrobiales bacterium]
MPLHLPLASTLKACAAITLSLVVLAGAAQAGIAPKKMHVSRERVAEVCKSLGADGRGIGLEATSGKYGCENLANGGTLLCEESGACKYYFYDPRTKWFKKGPQEPNRIIVTPRVRAV